MYRRVLLRQSVVVALPCNSTAVYGFPLSLAYVVFFGGGSKEAAAAAKQKVTEAVEVLAATTEAIGPGGRAGMAVQQLSCDGCVTVLYPSVVADRQMHIVDVNHIIY